MVTRDISWVAGLICQIWITFKLVKIDNATCHEDGNIKFSLLLRVVHTNRNKYNPENPETVVWVVMFIMPREKYYNGFS